MHVGGLAQYYTDADTDNARRLEDRRIKTRLRTGTNKYDISRNRIKGRIGNQSRRKTKCHYHSYRQQNKCQRGYRVQQKILDVYGDRQQIIEIIM